MTIRKTTTPALTSAISPAATRGLALTALMISLTGCGMLGSVVEQDKLDYHGAKKASNLDVPPDLTQLQKDNRYSVPDGRGIATASSFKGKGTLAAPAPTPGAAIGPVNSDTIHVERAGTQRWLVVNQTPEQLWPQLKQFWADSGFTIVSEAPATGTMETDWVENRSKIPQDFIRRSIGKVFDSAYSTGERDKFRTRLERTANGGTEIYISHRGAQEVLVGPQKESTTWTGRPNDPGLEAQFLTRLMARLQGVPDDDKKARAEVQNAVENPVVTAQHAKLVGDAVEVDEGFDRAWRRVGLALDRVGFTVEDRDRVQGVYFVRYVDPDVVAKQGFLKRLFTFGDASDKAKEAQRYRVLVKAESGATVSKVTVQDHDGKPESSPTGAKILKLLNEELK